MENARSTYLNLGIQTLPTQENKAPLDGIRWKEDVPAGKFNGSYGIGLKCGNVSNGLFCIDIDNHLGNAYEVCEEFLSDSFINNLLSAGKLFVSKTKSGGYHVVFFTELCDGNQKLARQQKGDIVKTVIETRGNGGYFCAFPTPGYEWSKYDLFRAESITKITKSEYDYLIQVAKSFNTFVSENDFGSVGNSDGSIRVGDLYNQDSDSHSEALNILISNGWNASGHKLTRPGKSAKDGISATFGRVAPGILYVFTSNAYPFEENKAYTPFQIKSLLEFSGDFSACAKSLAGKYGSETTPLKKEKKTTETELQKILEKSKIDSSKPIQKPKTILSIKQPGAMQTELVDVFHLSDFSVLSGRQKTKKTFLSSVIISSLGGCEKHSNKLYSQTHDGKVKCAFFDTEQGNYYAQKTAYRINQESGNISIDYFALREYDPIQRREIIEYYLKTNSNAAFIIIDGVVDLLYDFNNLEQSAMLVQWIMRITKQYDIHILNIIHQNKGDGNARGHLGTMLSQKAETIMEIRKSEEDNSSIISSAATRGRDFKDFQIVIDGNGNPILMEYEIKKESNIF